MSANYLHGVETIVVDTGVRPINVIKTAVVLLVGISPFGPKQTMTICQTRADDAQFGLWHPSNTIATSLDAIRKQGGALVVVINVFDPTDADHILAVSETHTVAGNKVKLTGLYAADLVVRKGVTTLVVDMDYSFNAATNTITILNTADYGNGNVLTCEFDAVNLATVPAASINGGIVAGDAVGLELADEAMSRFGFDCKILTAPFFSHLQSVAGKLIEKADKYRAIALLDAPFGATPTDAITGRGGTTGTVKNFFTSSRRAYLLYPGWKVENMYAATTPATLMNMPYSAFMAGVMAASDNERGYWYSPSNVEILGVAEPERFITTSFRDPNSQNQLLNEKGICTFLREFGTGYRTYGNDSAAFPTDTAPERMIVLQRIADVIHDSLELGSLQFIDKPINSALIDQIRATGNSFMRQLIQRGAIVDGEVKFEAQYNPDVQIAQGQLVFTIEFMGPPALGRLTYRSFTNISLLNRLTAA